jgi:glucose/arabinose dehydrogenase
VSFVVRFISLRLFALGGAAGLIAACAQEPLALDPDQYGPNPVLPAPDPETLPVIDIAPAVGWKDGQTPRVADGMRVAAFATGLDHPRWLLVLPNGDVLVAETNAPPRPDDRKGLKGWVMGKVMKRAGAATPSANRITLLRDADGDGRAETRSVFIEGLNSPFGMTLVGDRLYVANTDGVVRFDYQPGQTQLQSAPTKVADLPGGPLNHHWTKNIVASHDGARLYATSGSNSNIAENGMDKEERRAAILEIDLATGATREYATGLRNPNGLAWHPESGDLWTVVNERDGLGDNLVPDYMTIVRDGAFYGWPYSYYGQHVDARVEPARPDLVAKAVKPDYALGSHTASLGLAFYTGETFPGRYRAGAFIGQHGSWNSSTPRGYRVIFVPFTAGKPSGQPEEVLTDFVDDEGKARGRPVGVAIDAGGGLLVADDVGNCIWRVTPAAEPSRASAREAALSAAAD